MSTTTDINKLVSRAYTALESLNNIQWTPYRDRCFEMAQAEERAHVRCAPDDYQRPCGYSVNGAARLFVVKRIAEYLVQYLVHSCKTPTIADVLHYQPSAIYAASIVANYPQEIIAALAGFDIEQLARLDYCKYVGSN